MNREDYVLMGPIALMRRCEALEADAARLDWLENEMERELTCTTHLIGRPQGISLFRRNMPITRAAIDEAMKCHEESVHMDDEWIDIDALVAQQDPAAIAAARLSLAQSLADKLGFQLVPQKPTAALLRPFMECPDDELELAWQAMLHIAKVACTPSGGLER